MTDSPVTLITGGSSGIGAAAARQLLKLGHRVTVTARGEERLQRFAEELGRPEALLTLTGDASDPADVQAAVTATVERFGRLDNAVANAGFGTAGTLADGDPEHWRAMVLTNVLGPALLINAALPALKESRGRIVLVGSVAGHINIPGNFYGATKWAVTGLAENTRLLVTGSGVGVTLVAPGRVETGFWNQPGGSARPDAPMLTDDQIAASIVWALTQPAGVDVTSVMVRPIGQDR
ncbi:SDR family oxidoreductase [Kitasatospora viridis]|uniref:NADP-dependent 3-hydroxy acid dehydrogenase YdfG n=1 Tax=Kitasatospora viridis TaxID=281105 RepID=A0A561TT42_9ACTN|nr:SDR family oxidoreductase [Kitasatospora viridis]TWF90289.1 NADP-dependent 3-hydroxy acid dehydrogenase YdfG [Kitasatospora viridis]